jgi:NDP-mannose synthase
MGALAYMNDLEDDFLVMNGDICTDMDFRVFFEGHLRGGATATIGTYPRREQIELGVLKVDPDGTKIVAFEEKPVYNFWVSMGVYAFKRSIVDLIPKGHYFGFDDLMHTMLAKQVDVRPYSFRGTWYDIGRVDDYEKMLQHYQANPTLYEPWNRA